MSNSDNSDEPGQLLTAEQATAFQQLHQLSSDIEEQGHSVATAANVITEALDKGGSVSLEMMNHVKAQILKAHLQLDDLEQLLDRIG